MNFSGIQGHKERLEKDLDGLGKFDKVAGGGIMRPTLSQAALAAPAWLKEAMRDAGLEVREGAVAKIIGRLNPKLDLGHPRASPSALTVIQFPMGGIRWRSRYLRGCRPSGNHDRGDSMEGKAGPSFSFLATNIKEKDNSGQRESSGNSLRIFA